MKKNVLRELLNQGKPTLGTHVLIPWPGMAELIGLTGAFDYIEYVGEYSTFTTEQLENFGRAIDLFPDMSSMMKVEEQTRGFIAQRAIGHGLQNLLFTDCRNADDVRECIRLVLPETPEDRGTHGARMLRNVGYVQYSGTPEWVKAMEDTVMAFMIEKKTAMDELDEILSIPHVDMVQFGPNDYSISDGRPGQNSSPRTQQAQRDMIEKAIKKGVAARVEIKSADQAKPFIEMGVKHFCVGWDLRIIFDWCKAQGPAMREAIGKV
ncbi:MAG: aldolase/citrate lyase family protein [Syntrophales bacterium]